MVDTRETSAPVIGISLEGGSMQPTEAVGTTTTLNTKTKDKIVPMDDEKGEDSKAPTKTTKPPRRSRRTKQHSSLSGLFSAPKNAPKMTHARKPSHGSSEATAGSTHHVAIHSHQNGERSTSLSSGKLSPLTLVKVDTCNDSVDSDLSHEEYTYDIEITVSDFMNEKHKGDAILENDLSQTDANENRSKDKKRNKSIKKKVSKQKSNSFFSRKSIDSHLTTEPTQPDADADGSEEQPSAKKLVILSTTDNEQYVEEVKDVEIPELPDEYSIEMVQNVKIDVSTGYLGTEPLGGTAVLDAEAGVDFADTTAESTLLSESQDDSTNCENPTTKECTHVKGSKMSALAKRLAKAKSLFATKNTEDGGSEKEERKPALDILNADTVSLSIIPEAMEEETKATRAGDVPSANPAKMKVMIVSTINIDEPMKETNTVNLSKTKEDAHLHMNEANSLSVSGFNDTNISQEENGTTNVCDTVGTKPSLVDENGRPKVSFTATSSAEDDFNGEGSLAEIGFERISTSWSPTPALSASEEAMKKDDAKSRAADDNESTDVKDGSADDMSKFNDTEPLELSKSDVKESKTAVKKKTNSSLAAARSFFSKRVLMSHGSRETKQEDYNEAQEAQDGNKEVKQWFEQNIGPLLPNDIDQEAQQKIKEAICKRIVQQEFADVTKKDQIRYVTEPSPLLRACSTLSKTDGASITDIDAATLSKAIIDELEEAGTNKGGSSDMNLPMDIDSACSRDVVDDSCSATSHGNMDVANEGNPSWLDVTSWLDVGDEQSLREPKTKGTVSVEINLPKTVEPVSFSFVKHFIDLLQDEERDEEDNLQLQRDGGPVRDDSSLIRMNKVDSTIETFENALRTSTDDATLATRAIDNDYTPDASLVEADGLSKRAFSFPEMNEKNAINTIEGQNLLSQSEDPVGILAE